eukprot:CAMPEP_0174703268 /NCGR_PEP_ID=MMETSP1094-20130205/7275_1 /TAXON_ID=156173 /ORGANISM="Chrysochromulina brevifilum, Strain UTEX LB 985" /LENGTH=158 /DNA_ID=CAMNT_0015901161 /DNA_START=1147 /DNA_END=1621 /DNA_ORIENTATION=+
MPSVAGEHGPAATSLPQAAPGTCGGSPRGRSRAPLRRPRERRKRGDRAAALCCAGGGRRFLRTSPELAEPPASPAAAGTRAQRPGATSTVLPATAAATSAVLGGGGAAAFWRPQRLARAAFAGGGEASDVGSGRGSAPKDAQLEPQLLAATSESLASP